MTDKRYGISLAILVSITPAILGAISIFIAITQFHFGSLVMGLIFIGIAWGAFNAVYTVVKKRNP